MYRINSIVYVSNVHFYVSYLKENLLKLLIGELPENF